MAQHIPGQRKPGQTGRGGKTHHTGSMAKSWNRGGNPQKGGGGTGKKPPGDGCAVVALAMIGGVVSAAGAAGYGVFKLFS